jgi:hypothetical protein
MSLIPRAPESEVSRFFPHAAQSIAYFQDYRSITPAFTDNSFGLEIALTPCVLCAMACGNQLWLYLCATASRMLRRFVRGLNGADSAVRGNYLL